MTDYKEGDFAYCEFDLVQVEKVENGHVTSVNFGGISMGGCSIEKEMIPLTLDNKLISNEFKYIYRTLHEKGSSGLNYPQFKSYLTGMWLTAFRGGDVDALINQAQTFVRNVLNAQKNTMIDGIHVMRQ